MTASEIKTRLDALGSLGTIKIGSLPATPDAVGVIYEYGGLAPIRRFGVVGVGYERPALQIAFRGDPEDYNGPRTKAETALRNLAQIQGTTILSGTEYLQADPQQSVFPVLPKDVNNRHTLGFNIYILKSPS